MSTSKVVLYIDDDEDDRELIREAINTIDPSFEVIHAPSGIKGLDILKDLHQNNKLPCLIILDVNMPVMDGKETLKQIRNIYKLIPVVLFTTGITATTKELNDVVLKYHAHLEGKPNNMKEMILKVQRMLSYCQ